MHSHVDGQLGSLVESGSTLTTSKRFFLAVFGMSAHVVTDMAFEGFAAYIAFVKTFVLMKRQDVSFESICSGIGFVT